MGLADPQAGDSTRTQTGTALDGSNILRHSKYHLRDRAAY